MMPRVESETSDLGDSKSDGSSFANTPRSSTYELPVELNSLIKSAETDIWCAPAAAVAAAETLRAQVS